MIEERTGSATIETIDEGGDICENELIVEYMINIHTEVWSGEAETSVEYEEYKIEGVLYTHEELVNEFGEDKVNKAINEAIE